MTLYRYIVGYFIHHVRTQTPTDCV